MCIDERTDFEIIGGYKGKLVVVSPLTIHFTLFFIICIFQPRIYFQVAFLNELIFFSFVY